MSDVANRAAVLILTRLLNYGLMLISPLILVRLLTVVQFGEYREFLLYASLMQTIGAFFIPDALLYFIGKHPDTPWRLARYSARLTFGTSLLLASALVCGDRAAHGMFVGALLVPLLTFTLCSVNLDFWEAFWLAQKRPYAVLAYSTGRLVARIAVVTITAAVTRNVTSIIWAVVSLEATRLVAAAITLRVLDRSAAEPPLQDPWRSFARYCLPSGGASLLSMLSRSITSLAVVRVLGATALAQYSIGRFGEPIVLSTRNSISAVLLPEMVRLRGKAAVGSAPLPQSEALALWQRAAVVNALILFPASVILACCSDRLVLAAFGPAYLPAALLLRLYALVVVREAFDFAPALRAAGRTAPLARSNLLALAGCVVSLTVLIPSAGLAGAMLSLVIASLIDAAYLARATVQTYGIGFARLLPWSRLCKVALACVVASVLLRGSATRHFPPLWSLTESVLLFCVAFVCLVLALRVREARLILRRLWPLRSSGSEPRAESGARTRLVGESIVCFAGEDWWYHNPHSNKHLMEAFARGGNRILFVNSTGIRTPSVLHDRHGWRRIGRKLRSLAIFLRRAEFGLFVLTPIALPITRRMRRLVCGTNLLLIVAQTRLVCAVLGLHRPILWVASPASITAAIALRQRWARLLVYYCTDNIAFFRGADTAFIRSLDLKMQATADLTFVSGRRLFQERADLGDETYRLPHGVDYAHFEQARLCAGAVPADVRALRGPIVGFIGAICGLDVELIASIAQRNPHVSFVFIGKVLMDVSRLRNIRNVHLLGFRPYTQLPDYLRSFRCCMICYRRGDPFNDYRSPKKLLEYFAAGHPLVSVTLAELEDHAPLVYQADDAEQFHEQLQRALRENDPQLPQRRIEVALARDWSIVAAEAARHMRRHLEIQGTRGVIAHHLPQSSA